MKTESIIFKILTIAYFLVTTWSLLEAYSVQTIGYESSIYTHTPQVFWLSLMYGFILGSAVIIWDIIGKKDTSSKLWVLGAFILVYSCFLLLSLFVIRGYYMWDMNADPASHIGVIRDLVANGYFNDTNKYPIMHILMAILSNLANIDIFSLHKFTPLFLPILCSLLVYLLVRDIFDDINVAKVSIILTSLFPLGWYISFTPNGFANLLFPLLLIILIKTIIRQTWEWKILLLTVSVMYPLFHILPTIAFELVLVSLLIYWLMGLILQKGAPFSEINPRVLASFGLLILIWLIYWYSSFRIWEIEITNIYDAISMESGDSKFSSLLESASSATSNGYSLHQYAISNYGVQFVILFTGMLGIPVLIRENFCGHVNGRSLLFILPMFTAIIVIALLYLSHMTFGPLRFLFYLILFALIYSCFFIHYVLKRSYNRSTCSNLVRMIIILVLITGLFLISTFGLYPSPSTLQISGHTTQQDVEGLKWLLSEKDRSVQITGISISPLRFYHLLFGIEVKDQHIVRSFGEDRRVPYHFGYSNMPNIGNCFRVDAYLLLTERDICIYQDVFPDMASKRWMDTDFTRLYSDESINHIYSNYETDVWYITSTNGIW